MLTCRALNAAANVKAGLAIVNTNLAAGMGGLTWMLLDFRLERKWSAVGFCTGAICGLVAITPAAGFVSPGPSIFIGVMASATSNLLTTLKGFFVRLLRTSSLVHRWLTIASYRPLMMRWISTPWVFGSPRRSQSAEN